MVRPRLQHQRGGYSRRGARPGHLRARQCGLPVRQHRRLLGAHHPHRWRLPHPGPCQVPARNKWLGQQIHALGLRFGIYTSIGSATCKGLPGSLGHYVQDVGRFAYWGVDFIKADYCHAGTQAQATADYRRFWADVKAVPRPMQLNIALPVQETVGSSGWARAVTRAVGDSAAMGVNSWILPPNLSSRLPAEPQIMQHLQASVLAANFASPGHWNDLDIVSACAPVFGWSATLLQQELSIWAQAASQLLIGCSPAGMPSADRALFANRAMIAIDQSGAVGHEVAAVNGVVLVTKPGSVLIVNTTGSTVTATFTQAQLGNPSVLTDVWSGVQTPVTGPVTWTAGPYGVKLLAGSRRQCWWLLLAGQVVLAARHQRDDHILAGTHYLFHDHSFPAGKSCRASFAQRGLLHHCHACGCWTPTARPIVVYVIPAARAAFAHAILPGRSSGGGPSGIGARSGSGSRRTRYGIAYAGRVPLRRTGHASE